MTDEAETQPLRPQRKPEVELKALAWGIVTNRVFIANQPEGIKHAFGHLIAMSSEHFDEETIRTTGAFYEFFEKAGPMTNNGYPMFLSMRILHVDDLAFVLEECRKFEEIASEASAEVGALSRILESAPKPKLTLGDLHMTLEDDRHLGWGYACLSDLAPSIRQRLDGAIVHVANELELDYERLFHWSNSKAGRYLHDGVRGRGEKPNRDTVRKYLNPEAIAVALDF